MKSGDSSRCAPAACAAAILLAGCSETNSTLPRSNAGTQSTRLGKPTPTLAQSPGGGGAFSGGYSSVANLRPCTGQHHSGRLSSLGNPKSMKPNRRKWQTGDDPNLLSRCVLARHCWKPSIA
jgi:hypothetical protein